MVFVLNFIQEVPDLKSQAPAVWPNLTPDVKIVGAKYIYNSRCSRSESLCTAVSGN